MVVGVGRKVEELEGVPVPEEEGVAVDVGVAEREGAPAVGEPLLVALSVHADAVALSVQAVAVALLVAEPVAEEASAAELVADKERSD